MKLWQYFCYIKFEKASIHSSRRFNCFIHFYQKRKLPVKQRQNEIKTVGVKYETLKNIVDETGISRNFYCIKAGTESGNHQEISKGANALLILLNSHQHSPWTIYTEITKKQVHQGIFPMSKTQTCNRSHACTLGCPLDVTYYIIAAAPQIVS